MAKPYDIITFDCYGTLIDWDAGISAAFLGAAARRGVKLERVAVLGAYADHEPAVQAEGYRSYREVLAETSRRAAEELGWSVPSEDASFLADSLPSWPPFPDTVPALERLARAGYRLGLLSNVDPDLLEQTRRRLHVPFDLIVTAADVRSYKPAHGHFVAARERIGGARWLHAAQSYFHDMIPACALGVPAAWINRKDDTQVSHNVRPVFTVRTLTGLADTLERLS